MTRGLADVARQGVVGGEVGFIQGILAGCLKCLERLAKDNAHVRADYGRKLELGIG
jgi:hypothetical protein